MTKNEFSVKIRLYQFLLFKGVQLYEKKSDNSYQMLLEKMFILMDAPKVGECDTVQ